MRVKLNRPLAAMLLASAALSAPALVAAQDSVDPSIIVNGPQMVEGPEIKGMITARNDDKVKVTSADGTSTVIALSDVTKVKASTGLFSGGKAKPTLASLINGLPVEVKTWQSDAGLVARQITYKGKDMKVASMIRGGTEQGFAEQTAATAALRSRVGDIDNYNVKGTTNVYFDTGKWQLSPQAKAELCTTAAQAESTDNALLLVVGYTDAVGSEEYNQTLSEKRASSVINYLQQACRWKPYRVLTPTGMAEADPLADNDTPEGKAQNRRVAVNIMVSKAVDGLN